MNQYVITKEQYQTVKQNWFKNCIGAQCEMYLLYNFLRSKPLYHGFSKSDGHHNKKQNSWLRCRIKLISKNSLDDLNKFFGIEFTPELQTKFLEAQK